MSATRYPTEGRSGKSQQGAQDFRGGAGGFLDTGGVKMPPLESPLTAPSPGKGVPDGYPNPLVLGFMSGWLLGDAIGLGKTWDPLGLRDWSFGSTVFGSPQLDTRGFTAQCHAEHNLAYSGHYAVGSACGLFCDVYSGYFGTPADLVPPGPASCFNVLEVIYDPVFNFTSTHVLDSYAVDVGTSWAPGLYPGTYVAPVEVPSEHPEMLPMLQPAIVTPQRYREAVADPGSQPDSDSKKAASPLEVPGTPWPVTLVDIVPGRLTVPDQSVDIDPSPVPKPGDQPAPEPAPDLSPGRSGTDEMDQFKDLKPPRAREKQRKINVRNIGFGSKLWVLGNILSEGFEAVDDLWRALPKECKTKQWRVKANGKRGRRASTPYEKARDLYACWTHIDQAKAFENIVNDQVTDIFYAMQGRLGTKATQRLNINTGLQHMLREGQNAIGAEYQRESGNKAPRLPVPHLSHDGKTWQVDFLGYDVVLTKSSKRDGFLSGQ